MPQSRPPGAAVNWTYVADDTAHATSEATSAGNRAAAPSSAPSPKKPEAKDSGKFEAVQGQPCMQCLHAADRSTLAVRQPFRYQMLFCPACCAEYDETARQ